MQTRWLCYHCTGCAGDCRICRINCYTMATILTILVFILFIFGVVRAENAPEAETENGMVVGTLEKSYAGFTYKAFRGIPYAEPPVGSNRFKEPQRLKDKWIGTWQATSYGSNCLQLDEFSDKRHEFILRGEEDCLFLNVFTQVKGPPKKDVVFMIHGGAFMFGSGDMYGPKYMMDRDDIVYVSVNYRLGPLGFLSTGDGVVPGNNGLKDQIAALQWVNRNIANFGGDPAKVTIAGLSAGGASVDYQFLTSLSKGLFQRGVSFSGSALSPWALVENGPARTKQLAEILGCPTSNSKSLVKCLKKRPARQIVDEMRKMFVWMYHPFTMFGPVVEVNSSRPFIDRHPSEIHKLGLGQQLPWIGGVTTEEGLYPIAEIIDVDALLNEVNDDWLTLGESMLFLDPHLSTEAKKETLLSARKYYLGEKPINQENMVPFLKLFTDRLYGAGLIETVLNRAGGRLYEYGFQGATSVSHALSHGNKNYGASHGDDVINLVDFGMIPSHTTAQDREMAAVIKKIFFNFVKTGDVPKEYSDWEPLAISNKYLRIKSPGDVKVTDEPFIDIEIHKRIFKRAEKIHDEL